MIMMMMVMIYLFALLNNNVKLKHITFGLRVASYSWTLYIKVDHNKV